MDRNRWILFIIIVIAVLGLLVFLSRGDSVDVSTIDQSVVQTGDLPDNVKGHSEADIVLIEYGDLACSACAQAHPNINTIADEYGDRVAFVFRHFPLSNIHPNALAASAANEAAGKQGKFWEMNDLLYSNQSQWTAQAGISGEDREAVFENFARELSLDIEQFNADRASDVVRDKIDLDRALRRKSDVGGTPSYFIGETKLDSEIVGDVVQGSGQQLRAELDRRLGESEAEKQAE